MLPLTAGIAASMAAVLLLFGAAAGVVTSRLKANHVAYQAAVVEAGKGLRGDAPCTNVRLPHGFSIKHCALASGTVRVVVTTRALRGWPLIVTGAAEVGYGQRRGWQPP